jgi:hypothetical protein
VPKVKKSLEPYAYRPEPIEEPAHRCRCEAHQQFFHERDLHRRDCPYRQELWAWTMLWSCGNSLYHQNQEHFLDKARPALEVCTCLR